MSLINDALKRARHEALRQDSKGGPTVYGAVPAHSRRSQRPWILFVAGAGVTVAVVAVLWLAFGPSSAPADGGQSAGEGALRPPEHPQQVAERSAEVEQAAQDGATRLPATSETSGGVASVAQGPLPREGAERGVPVPEPSPSEPALATTAQAPPPEESSPFRQPSGERLRAGETYLRRATAADGSEVRLGGIAYSDTHPIAVINGAVVSAGDLIAGFTVVAVEPERVELEVGGVRFFLVLH